MALLKLRFFKSFNSLILFLISLLGFSTSCSKDEDIARMYGSPHAKYIISGKVVSVTDNKPIPDIIISMRRVFENEGSNLVATDFSHTQGDYLVAEVNFPSNDRTFNVKFMDTDGPLNGEYETLDTTIVFQDPKYTGGDGSWYSGFTEKTLDVKLKPKK